MLIAVLALLAVIRFVNLELQFVTTSENREVPMNKALRATIFFNATIETAWAIMVSITASLLT